MTRSRRRLSILIASIAFVASQLVAAQLPPTQRGTVSGSAPSASPSHTAGSVPKSSVAVADLLISSGDLLEVGVFGYPDFNQAVRVSARGDVSLPMVGTILLEGLTAREAQDEVRKRLIEGGFFKDPQVSVFIKEYATQGASVLGEVNKPGVYPVFGERRLYDLISAAGGLSAKAGKTVTITHRSQPDRPSSIELSINGGGDVMAHNVKIFPGDTVVVSQAGVVYVIGDVGKPSGFTMDNDESMTLLQALALAGGTNHTAALKTARLIRKENGAVQDITVPLSKILQAKAADVSLRPGDVVFVPTSATKSATRRSLEAIVQAATGLAIYRR